MERIPVLFPVRGTVRSGKMRSHYKTHRKSGPSSQRRRTGESAPVQADQPPLQCTSFGRAYQPSGSGRQRRTLSRIIRIQGKYPDGLPRTRILPRSRYRCLGLYTVDNKNSYDKAGITRRPKCRAFSPPELPRLRQFHRALFATELFIGISSLFPLR